LPIRMALGTWMAVAGTSAAVPRTSTANASVHLTPGP
jgi:hypothetical protein